jgi:hypothetical protein
MGGTGRRNEQTCRWVQKENGELTIISLMGENKDEKQQWNRKRWVHLIEVFMYFGNAYILSWDETAALYMLLGILITLVWKTIRWMRVSAHFFNENTFSPLIASLEILNNYCRLMYESPLAKKQRQCQPFMSRNDFPEHCVIFWHFFSNLIKNSRHSGEIRKTHWPTENSSLPANVNHCTHLYLCTVAFATTAALFL